MHSGTGDLAFGELSSNDSPFEEQFRGGLKFLDGVRFRFSPAVLLASVLFGVRKS